MNNLKKGNVFFGFKITPILATLTFICGLCLFLEHTVDPDMNSTLTCFSDTYRVGNGFESSQQLLLRNAGHGIEVVLNLFDGNKLSHSIIATGSVKQLNDSILTYEISLDGALKPRLWQTDFNPVQQNAAKLAALVVNDAESKTFVVKVLEMNKAARVVTVKIDPSNSLWVCKISK